MKARRFYKSKNGNKRRRHDAGGEPSLAQRIAQRTAARSRVLSHKARK